MSKKQFACLFVAGMLGIVCGIFKPSIAVSTGCLVVLLLVATRWDKG